MNTPALVDVDIDSGHDDSVLNGDCSGAARAVPLGSTRAQALSRQLQALAQPVRVQLLSIIRDGVDDSTCICQLQRQLGLSKAELDAHVTAMHTAGLIRAHRRGAWTYYSAQPDCCADLHLALSRASTAMPGANVTS